MVINLFNLLRPYPMDRNMIDIVFIPVRLKGWVRFDHGNKIIVIF